MRHASVFSGIGGPEVAAEMLGWENLFHCEINPFGRAILDYWFPNSESYEDITKTDFSKWRGQVDVLTGGFPCQPFSYAGQRRGSEDDRYLWPYMFRCIDQIRPDWVVAENVAGILTMVEQGKVSPMESQGTLFDEVDGVPGWRLRETFTLQRICDDLEGHGYEVQPVLIPACGVGAPHRRDRVFIIGHRNDITNPSFMHLYGSQSGDGCDGSGEPKPEFGSDNRKKDEGRVTTDTASERLGRKDQSGRGEGGQRLHLRRDGTRRSGQDIRRDATHPTDERLQRRHNCDTKGHGQSSDGCTRQPCEGMGRKRNVADTRDAGLQEARPEQQPAGPRGFGVRTGEWVERFGRGEESGSRWLNFPSVSPVHRGNDGLPFDVDDLTISFSKWRTESLKAYGNAIVPQVMYEIFRAIQIITDKTQKP